MKKILVPVDFLKASLNASEYALDIAIRLNAAIRLHHSFYEPVVTGEMPEQALYGTPVITEDIVENMEKNARYDMEQLENELLSKLQAKGAGNIKIESEIMRGLPEDDILLMAEEWRPDLIVMGSRKEGKTMKSIFGSVSSVIVENSRIPVLVVPETCRYRGIKNILFATDFDEPVSVFIQRLKKLAQVFSAQIHCVHISRKKELIKEKQEMANLELQWKKQDADAALFRIVEGEDVVNSISDYIRKEKIDLITLTMHKRNFLARLIDPGITKEMLFESNVPLLVFHQGKEEEELSY